MECRQVVYVAAGPYHTACIDKDGKAYTWGQREYGRLGHGDEATISNPKVVNGTMLEDDDSGASIVFGLSPKEDLQVGLFGLMWLFY